MLERADTQRGKAAAKELNELNRSIELKGFCIRARTFAHKVVRFGRSAAVIQV
jgi:hypothetical protein